MLKNDSLMVRVWYLVECTSYKVILKGSLLCMKYEQLPDKQMMKHYHPARWCLTCERSDTLNFPPLFIQQITHNHSSALESEVFRYAA